MAAIKFRVFAAIAGAVMGLGAFVLACQALTTAMINWLGPTGGLTASAGILAVLALAAFVIVSRPIPEMDEEMDEAKSAAADMFAGIPGEAVLSLVRKHPITVVMAALMLGYTLIRDPGRAMRQFQSIVVGLL